MSNSSLIEIVAVTGEGFGFGPVGMDETGDRISHSSKRSWNLWLQNMFGSRFQAQAPCWERIHSLEEGWRPVKSGKNTFDHLAGLLAENKLQARRLPVPALPPETGSTEAVITSSERSQRPRPVKASTLATTSAERGIAMTDPGVDADQMQSRGDPVAPATGEEILVLEDFTVGAPMPLCWRRWYRSRYCDRNLGLGSGWFAECLRLIWQDDEATWLIDDEARPVRMPLLAPGEIAWQAIGGQRLERKTDDSMVLTERDGRLWILMPDGLGNWRPASVQNALGHQWLFHYDAQKRLVGLDLTPRKHIEFSYGQGQCLQRISLRYDDRRLTLATYRYATSSELVAATSPSGTERYGYQGRLLVDRELPTGYHFLFHWDGDGPQARCLRTHGEDGLYDFRFDYQPEKFQTRVTDASGSSQVFHYDGQGRITAREDSDTTTHHWQYNARGQLTAYRLPDGRVTRYGFDALGRPVIDWLPDGRARRREFNALGFCVAETLPDGRKVQRRFDPLGRLRAERRSDGSQWRYQYDGQGWLKEAVSDAGEVRRTGVGPDGELLAVEHQGKLIRYAFDGQGRLKGRLSQDLVTEYDYLGQRVSAVHQYPEQAPGQRRSRFYHYDEGGRLTGFASAAGELHGFAYNGLAKPIRYVRPDGKIVHYQYGEAHCLTRVTRADGQQWVLSYDNKGQVSACKAPDGRSISFRYDAAGDIIHREQAGDWVQHLKRDAGGRLIEQASQGRNRGPVSRQFQYDAKGRRTGAACADRRLAWQYDNQGRITEHRQDRHSVFYDYGPGQQLRKLQLPDDTEIRYEYDHQGRWQGVLVNGAPILQRGFDNQGREQTRRAGDSNCQTQVWDRHDCLVNRRWQGVESALRRYSWDAESRLEDLSDTLEGNRTFKRDLQGQLIAENQQTFDYDPGDNRRLKGAILHQDRLVKTDTATRKYDALGAETEVRSKSTQHRQFDAEGQLTLVKSEGLYAQYGYDALGRRAWRKCARGTTTYLWHNDVLLGEQRPDGRWQWYIREPDDDAPLFALIDGEPHYYELDWRGMPIRLWNSAGERVWQANADAWGRCNPSTPGGPIHQPIRLPGQFEDELTGLHFNRFRDYDPKTGRYLTPDPVGIKGGLNSYRYTPNPVDYIDPLGLAFSPIVTPENAHFAEMAGIPADVTDMQEVGALVALGDAVIGAVSAISNAVRSVVEGLAWAVRGALGAAVGATYAFSPGMAPEDIPESIKDAARAADLAYVNTRDTHFGEWVEVGFDEDGFDTDGLGLEQRFFENEEESYYAKLFRNIETGDYMVAFRGTDEGIDWKHNGLQGVGMESSQYDIAMGLARQAKDLIPVGTNLSFTGDSLGGGLASAASAVTGLQATTFNAAGLNPNTVRRLLKSGVMPETDQINAVFVKGDILSAIQDPFHDVFVSSAAGRRIPLNNSGFKSPLVRHGMSAVGDAMGIVLNRGAPNAETVFVKGS